MKRKSIIEIDISAALEPKIDIAINDKKSIMLNKALIKFLLLVIPYKRNGNLLNIEADEILTLAAIPLKAFGSGSGKGKNTKSGFSIK